MVNGSDVEEDVNMGAAIIPNLDSIAEFRILTNNFDAEYGEFSGGQINVVTKSGTNHFMATLSNSCATRTSTRATFFLPRAANSTRTSSAGRSAGRSGRTRFSSSRDYQGTRSTQGVDTGQIPVPSAQDRTGNLSDLASSFVTTDAEGNTVPTTVSGTYWAGVSDGQPGLHGHWPASLITRPAAPASTCVFPGAVIPQSAWSAPATNLLKYIPTPNNANGTFSTSAFNETLRDDKGAYRLDANTRWGLLSAYYFLDDWSQNNPYPVAQGGANVPGFNALYTGRSQLIDLGDTKTLGPTAVNEFHFSYLRDANDLGKPVGGVGVSLASQGFEVGPGTPGIVALSPKTEGVESVGFNSFTIGTNTNELKQVGNTFQVARQLFKSDRHAHHQIRRRIPLRSNQRQRHRAIQRQLSFLRHGNGSDFADFLLGIPSQYNQSQLQPFYGRNKYVGLYAQDSWRVPRSLTLNYGLRWDRIEPWYEKYNQIATFVPGEQSVVFPGAPAGILYPTDPGVPRTLAPPGNRDFAPRIGLAYSPSASGDGVLAKIFGGPGKTSIRASYGMFYTAIEALTIGVMAPTHLTEPPTPARRRHFSLRLSLLRRAAAVPGGQVFPVTLAPLNSTAKHPDDNINWSQFEPITGLPNYLTTNRIPYTEEYMLSLERGLGANTVLSVNYVGTQAHRLLVIEESNPGDPHFACS